MVRTLLLLIISAYGMVCCADASVSEVALGQSPVKNKRVGPLVRVMPAQGKTKGYQAKAKQKTPVYTAPVKRRVSARKSAASVNKPPVLSYTPPTAEQANAATRKNRELRQDRIETGVISRALTIHNDSKASIAQKTNAANEILVRHKRLKTSEKQASVQKLLRQHGLTQNRLEQEVNSGRALMRVQEHAARGRSKNDPEVAADLSKITDPSHRKHAEKALRAAEQSSPAKKHTLERKK